MVSILAVIHLVICVFVILLVLIQDPKGGAAGGMFGGGGGADSLFGATGAPTFLAKITRYVAMIFAVSCIAMTIFTKPSDTSVLQNRMIPSAGPTPEADTTPVPTEEPAAPPASEEAKPEQ